MHHITYPKQTRLQGCPFLVKAGCYLPWRTRPYACPHLFRALHEKELKEVVRALEWAGDIRSKLVGAFTR